MRKIVDTNPETDIRFAHSIKQAPEEGMPHSGYLKHISVSVVGGVRVVSCLHCGFSIGGTNEELLTKIIQQHKCRDERGPTQSGQGGAAKPAP